MLATIMQEIIITEPTDAQETSRAVDELHKLILITEACESMCAMGEAEFMQGMAYLELAKQAFNKAGYHQAAALAARRGR